MPNYLLYEHPPNVALLISRAVLTSTPDDDHQLIPWSAHRSESLAIQHVMIQI
jgi:hypothetical protein